MPSACPVPALAIRCSTSSGEMQRSHAAASTRAFRANLADQISMLIVRCTACFAFFLTIASSPCCLSSGTRVQILTMLRGCTIRLQRPCCPPLPLWVSGNPDSRSRADAIPFSVLHRGTACFVPASGNRGMPIQASVGQRLHASRLQLTWNRRKTASHSRQQAATIPLHKPEPWRCGPQPQQSMHAAPDRLPPQGS